MVITRKVEFSASHVCRDPKLSEEENQRIYGLAANPLGHGHNYVVEVTLEGEHSILREAGSILIPAGATVELANPAEAPLEIVEIGFGGPPSTN